MTSLVVGCTTDDSVISPDYIKILLHSIYMIWLSFEGVSSYDSTKLQVFTGGTVYSVCYLTVGR